MGSVVSITNQFQLNHRHNNISCKGRILVWLQQYHYQGTLIVNSRTKCF